MNPTNESIGRAFREKHPLSIEHHAGARAFVDAVWARARELDRQAPGYAVLTNPYTGKPRDWRDVESDPSGILIHDGGPLPAAPQPPAQEQVWRYRFRDSESGGWHDWRYSESEPALTPITIGKTEVEGPFTRAAGAEDARDAVCTWEQADFGGGDYNTSCGHLFTINDGGPADNNFKHCCFCGGRLIEKEWHDESDAAAIASQAQEGSDG
jgi:hypothetical protein